MNIGKRNENKKREECGKRAMGKTFVKILAALLAGGVIGGIFGFGSFWLQEEGFNYMVTGWYQGYLNYAIYIQLAVFAVSGVLCLIFYLKAQNLVKQEKEELLDEIGRLENYALLVNAVGLVLLFLSYGLAADGKNRYFMQSTIVFLVTCMLSVVLEVLIIYQAKRLDPMKKGDPGDLTFSKQWMDSCDEAEKMIVWKAAYETYTVMKVLIMAAFVAALFGKVGFGTGNFPLVLIGILWLVQSALYMAKSMKMDQEGLER